MTGIVSAALFLSKSDPKLSSAQAPSLVVNGADLSEIGMHASHVVHEMLKGDVYTNSIAKLPNQNGVHASIWHLIAANMHAEKTPVLMSVTAATAVDNHFRTRAAAAIFREEVEERNQLAGAILACFAPPANRAPIVGSWDRASFPPHRFMG